MREALVSRKDRFDRSLEDRELVQPSRLTIEKGNQGCVPEMIWDCGFCNCAEILPRIFADDADQKMDFNRDEGD